MAVRSVAKKQTKERVTVKQTCLMCGKDKAISNYYNATSNEILKSGSMPICKDCMNEYIFDADGKPDLSRVKRIFMMCDIPFISQVFVNTVIDSQTMINPSIGGYIRTIILNRKGQGWLEGELDVATSDIRSKNEIFDFDESEAFWGRGLSKEDYEFLNETYRTFTDSYECDSPSMQMLLQQAAHESLRIRQKREKGGDVTKELKNFQDLLTSANLKPVQETGANATEQATFGTLIKKWENEKPIPEPDDAWKDVDGIAKYVKTWFLGHLLRMTGKPNEFAKEYNEEIDKYTVQKSEYDEDGDADGRV